MISNTDEVDEFDPKPNGDRIVINYGGLVDEFSEPIRKLVPHHVLLAEWVERQFVCRVAKRVLRQLNSRSLLHRIIMRERAEEKRNAGK